MSDASLGVFGATILVLIVMFAHWAGRAGAEAGIVLDCVTMKSFRAGSVVYDCKKKETER
tara:strand:- start:10 stop:189 length:180 start_codon:yes stop_codon:yes gene_type:complete